MFILDKHPREAVLEQRKLLRPTKAGLPADLSMQSAAGGF
jgi:hypothetical protein